MHAIVHPDGDMPPDHIATLRMTAITEIKVNKATFRDDIVEIAQEMEPLAYDLLDRRGKFRSGIWGRGSKNEGTGV